MNKQRVWGVRYVDELVCEDNAVLPRFYACQDANFNVTLAVRSNGSPQERFLYDPYGSSTVLGGGSWTPVSDTLHWTCRFTGQGYDSETQMYLFRLRYYHLLLGRFGSWDPMDYIDSPNLYQLVKGNPTGQLDWEGTQTDIDKKLHDACTIRRPCSECERVHKDRVQRLLNRIGQNPLGKGIAGAGKGIATGLIIKGGTAIAANTLEGSAWGPIGTIGGAAVGLAGTGAAVLDYHTAFTAYKTDIDEINRVYNDCLENCDITK